MYYIKDSGHGSDYKSLGYNIDSFYTESGSDVRIDLTVNTNSINQTKFLTKQNDNILMVDFTQISGYPLDEFNWCYFLFRKYTNTFKWV